MHDATYNTIFHSNATNACMAKADTAYCNNKSLAATADCHLQQHCNNNNKPLADTAASAMQREADTAEATKCTQTADAAQHLNKSFLSYKVQASESSPMRPRPLEKGGRPFGPALMQGASSLTAGPSPSSPGRPWRPPQRCISPAGRGETDSEPNAIFIKGLERPVGL